MKSRNFPVIAGILVLLVVVVGFGIQRIGSHNEHVAECKTMINYRNSYVSMSNEVFDALYDQSVTLESAQRNALTKLEAMIAWEQEVIIPEFGQHLADVSLESDQAWARGLQVAIGAINSDTTDFDRIQNMSEYETALSDLASSCNWNLPTPADG